MSTIESEEDQMAEVDYAIGEILDKYVPENGDFVPSIVAGKVVKYLRRTDPDLLAAWLDVHAEHFLTDRLGRRLIGIRSRALRQARATDFAGAVAAAEEGDYERLSQFSVVYTVDDTNTRRRVADMRGPDHIFVAERYEQDGEYKLLMAAFHRAVARKVKNRRTEEVLSEEQYERLLRSIIQRSQASAQVA